MSWLNEVLLALSLRQARLLQWFLADLSETGYVESDGFRCEWLLGEGDRRTHVHISHPRWEKCFMIQSGKLLVLRQELHRHIGCISGQELRS